MDYTEVLRRLAINDGGFAEDAATEVGSGETHLDPKTLALVRLAALVAVGGTVPSYGAETNAAVLGGHVHAVEDEGTHRQRQLVAVDLLHR